MVTSNIAVASLCCFLIGSVSSFLAPESRTQRIHRGQYYDAKKTVLSVHTPTPSSTSRTRNATANGAKPRRNNSNNVVDDLWTDGDQSLPTTADNGDTKTSPDIDSKSIISMMGLSLDNPLSQDINTEDIQTINEPETSAADSTKWILIGGTLAVLVAAGALAANLGSELGIDLELGQLFKDPSNSFDTILESLGTMDAEKGMIYFSSFYVLAEILAIPAVPILTASSGYLFGTLPGTATCLFSAAIAASISFVIGRTLLRGYVEGVLAGNPKFQSMDRAIEKEGFKLMLLLRLSPLFPFALSNYLYGASSIRFLPYFFGTLLGFAPGTFAYVYAGRVGKALLSIDEATSEPWYVYVGGMAVLVALLKIAGDVASGVIDSLEEEDGGGWDQGDMDI